MKSLSTLFTALALLFGTLFAQVPEGIHYQATIRDNGQLVTAQSVTVEFTIWETVVPIYRETQTLSTNAYGHLSAQVGTGTPSLGTFSAIDWTIADHNLQVRVDIGNGYEDLGLTELISVPFAQHAGVASAADFGLSGLQDVSAVSPANGEILAWNGSEWAPATDAVIDADADPANEIQSLALTGATLSLSGSNSVVLPTGTTYTAGTGISISGNVISNLGDTNPGDDITTSTAAGGDLSGTFPALTVNGLQGNPVSGVGPANNQILKWNGSAWAPAADEVDDADADPTNEIQTLGVVGTDLSLSNGGGTVSLLSYSAGAGINIAGSTISNTGDLDASDDITIGTAAGGDLSGTYPAPSVSGIQGQPVSATAPASGEVLKWDGSAWTPAVDDQGTSLWSQSGTDIYYSSGDVGIGTNSPSATLEVDANGSLSDPQIWLHEDGNDYARLNFDNNNGSNYWTIAGYIASNNQNDRLNFWNGTSGDLMTLTGDGELGLGVGISPKTDFHVGNGRRVLFGTDTLGNGDKLMWLPDLHAFRVGTVATGAASTYWNRDSIGLYSFASGLNTRAQGFGATAMGRDTEATNSYAFATGYFSNADGQYSTAMGFNTDAVAFASTALGYSTDAEENYSTALGYFSEAQAIYSVAIGNSVRAQSYASMAVGRYNVGGGSATTWNTSDPIFEIGIGTSPSNRANAVTVRKNGNVGIGTTFPGARLHVVGGSLRIGSLEELTDGGSFVLQVNSSLIPSTDNIRDLGNASFRWDDVFATNGTIQTSDLRDKKKVKPIGYGLNEIMQMRPVRFQWKDQPGEEEKLGLIAQDLLQVVPEVVKTHNYEPQEEDNQMVRVELERLGVYYSDLIPVMIQAMQEQQEEIEALKKEIAKLKKN